MKPDINIIIPLYNEEEVLPLLIARLNLIISSFRKKIQVNLMDDCSNDIAGSNIKAQCLDNPLYSEVLRSRNYGYEIALSAGLRESNALQNDGTQLRILH